MQEKTEKQVVIVDGSCLVTEAMARAGAGAFIGYPITPANLLYQYSARRMPLFLPAPDEISAVQWMSGLAATGKLPVTATSFPGFALMLESLNMAFMMELPMVIVLVQRLGPATGTATCGAQGDLALLRGMISGGHQIPVLCGADFESAWRLSAEAVHVAARLRTPVVYLTSKEEMMTKKSFDLSLLDYITAAEIPVFSGEGTYRSYEPGENGIPSFLPVGNPAWQVRLNASTHDRDGILKHSTAEALGNTMRLEEKSRRHLGGYTHYEYDSQEGAEVLVISYGVTASAAREAVSGIRESGKKVSLLVPGTILPVPDEYYDMSEKYERVVVAEENINAQYARLLFGEKLPERIRTMGAVGRMITGGEIRKEVLT